MTTAIIQARMGSNRLPGKILLELCGKPVLWHVLTRLSRAQTIDRVVVATTDLPEDDIVRDCVGEWGFHCARGSSDDVLSRYYHTAKQYPGDTIVRVTSDCPLIDPGLCDEIITYYNDHDYRYVSNSGADPQNRTYPRGLDCEVFSAALLEEAYKAAAEPYEREHVTPYMYWKNQSVSFYRNDTDISYLRWTLDTPEDWALIKAIYGELYHPGSHFTWRDVLAYYSEHPEWLEINREIEQKRVK